MEHIICKYIVELLEKQYILFTILQHGFRVGFSGDTQLIAPLQDLMRYGDKNIQDDMAIFDFSNVFNTLPHTKLIHKLKHCGINNNTFKWVGNFPKQRSQ